MALINMMNKEEWCSGRWKQQLKARESLMNSLGEAEVHFGVMQQSALSELNQGHHG